MHAYGQREESSWRRGPAALLAQLEQGEAVQHKEQAACGNLTRSL